MTQRITYPAFLAEYQPQLNHLYPHAPFAGMMFETFGEELAYLCQQPPAQLWTVVEGDDYPQPMLISGFHLTNRLGYFLTAIPVSDGQQIEVPL